jgi:hypothetical protein
LPTISTADTMVAPQRSAIANASPTWSAWAWVMTMVCGDSVSASTAALGLPVRNGSTSTSCEPICSAAAA